MFISARLFICPAFVFSLGLCSCEPKSDHPAPFRIDEPQWELKNGRTVKFVRGNDELPTHDLSDVLTFPNGTGDAWIEARCADGGRISHSKHRFSLPNKISFYSMLPEELLAPSRLTESAPVRCSLEFHVSNGEGSFHNFRMAEAVVEDRGSSIGVTARSKSQILHQDDFTKLKFVIDYGTQAKLACDEVDFSIPIPGNREISLDDFGIVDETQLKDRALRQCRLLGIHQDVVQSLSAPLIINFHSVMPKIEYLPTRQILHDLFLTPGPFPLLAFIMTNDQSFPLRFRLIKPSGADFAAGAFERQHTRRLGLTDALCAGATTMYHEPKLVMEKPVDGVRIRDDGDFFSVEMPAATKISGRIVTTVTVPRSNRAALFWPTSFLFKQVRPMRLESYQLENGNWLKNGTHEWGFLGLIWYSDVEVRISEEASVICPPSNY